MRTVTLESAQKNFAHLINHCLDSREELNIASSRGSVILIPEDDYESMQEMLRLLSDKKSLKALLESHHSRAVGKLPRTWSMQEVFDDV